MVAFAVLSMASSALALLLLIVWVDGSFASLAWVGVTGLEHAVALFAAAGIVACVSARWFFSRSQPSRLSGAMRGAVIATVAFLGTMLVHGSILSFRTDVSTAFWLTLSAAMFGGAVFGLPSVALGGCWARFCPADERRRTHETSDQITVFGDPHNPGAPEVQCS
jgi:hypothetical protein